MWIWRSDHSLQVFRGGLWETSGWTRGRVFCLHSSLASLVLFISSCIFKNCGKTRNICHISHLVADSEGALSACAVLCDHHHHHLQNFSSSPTETLSPLHTHSCSPLPAPVPTTSQLTLVNVGVSMSHEDPAFNSLGGIYPEVEFLGHRWVCF